MKSSFNVEEFNTIINDMIRRSNAAEDAMQKISSYIVNLKDCIGNQENASLYQSWNELKLNIDKVRQKYSGRKEEFLSELMNYKEYVLINNDEVYQSIGSANKFIDSIAAKIDAL